MAHQRPHLQTLKARMAEKRKFIQVLYGPRQVGKTTLVSQLLKQVKLPHLYASADGIANADAVWLQQQWETARLKSKQTEGKDFILALDEIQKVDNWSEAVKKLWDEDTRAKASIKVILTGSSRLLLQQGLTESLAGRFETIYMGHWSFSEMKKSFGFSEEQYAWFGGYPGAAELIEDEPRWKDYIVHSLIETSISRDVLMLTRVDKPALMKRLFELGCAYSGQILSYTKMLGQLLDAGNTTTLAHYLELLHSAGLLAGIEKYAGGKIRQRASSPKFLAHNTALIAAQRAETFSEARKRPDVWGRIVECAVGAHLLNHSVAGIFELYYWRDGNDEMDFVLKQGKKITALEVKTGAAKRISGAATFRKKFPAAKILVVEPNGLSWEQLLHIHPGELL
ncbi:MAG TPA: ATP-binding protein [Chitinophagales bacterium]|nr:ATP-binding protein [Chitinophagales bacterium]